MKTAFGGRMSIVVVAISLVLLVGCVGQISKPADEVQKTSAKPMVWPIAPPTDHWSTSAPPIIMATEGPYVYQWRLNHEGGALNDGSVTGRAVNPTDRMIDYADLQFGLYNADGELIDSTTTSINAWGPGEVWKFEAPVFPSNGRVFGAKARPIWTLSNTHD